MNPKSSRKTYGRLALSATAIRSIQLEWALVEQPAPSRRFLNFPLADNTPSPAAGGAQRDVHDEKRPLAA